MDEKESELDCDIKLSVDRKDDEVIISFNKPVTWVACPSLVALRISEEIKKLAEEILKSDI